MERTFTSKIVIQDKALSFVNVRYTGHLAVLRRPEQANIIIFTIVMTFVEVKVAMKIPLSRCSI
jgi:hypothetical protein